MWQPAPENDVYVGVIQPRGDVREVVSEEFRDVAADVFRRNALFERVVDALGDPIPERLPLFVADDDADRHGFEAGE